MMEDIESINVVRGPGSVVYGPGAVGWSDKYHHQKR